MSPTPRPFPTIARLTTWLETHWINPAFSGWLMTALALFFFASATNTMAGWLYVISGVMFALLAIAAVLPERSLRHIQIRRHAIQPVSAGETLTIELSLTNLTKQPKTLVQIQDMLPFVLAQPACHAIELIPAESTYHWMYHQPVHQRGIYRWHMVQLRTAAPLGLFWCRRQQTVKAMAIVYPTVLSLAQCPLIDQIGQDATRWTQSNAHTATATEGLTRTLRPYRWGDATRFIHWRTSARYGELRVRELETYTGGQELIVCLDSAYPWQPDQFEHAVTAAASLYFYALHRALQVSVWTAGTGVVRGDRAMLETLAATQAEEASPTDKLPDLPLLWLTSNPDSVNALPNGSRWLLWHGADRQSMPPVSTAHPGIVVDSERSLQLQLQATP